VDEPVRDRVDVLVERVDGDGRVVGPDDAQLQRRRAGVDDED
jgi:hypothetical protein